MRVAAWAGGLAAVVLTAGCGAAAGTTPGASVSTSSIPSVTTTTPTVSALSFDLPPEPAYKTDGTRTGDDGQFVRTWRAPAGSTGGSCVVVAGEQPGFDGAFPEAALTAFGLGHEDGSEIQYNERIPAIPGTVAGLRQSRTYRFSLGARGTSTGVVLVRQYLTTAHTLISLNVAGPADASSACGLQGIVDSLRVAGPGDQSPPLPTTRPSGIPPSPSEAESTP